jgi:hypothetical protein
VSPVPIVQEKGSYWNHIFDTFLISNSLPILVFICIIIYNRKKPQKGALYGKNTSKAGHFGK